MSRLGPGLVLACAVCGACGAGSISTDRPDVEPLPVCTPTAGGPYWILEGEPISVQVSCATELSPAPELAVEPIPPGATWDAATATLSWTPGLDQGAVWDLAVSAPALGESALLRIGVADRFDDPANVLVVDPARYTLEYGLPVMHVFPTAPVTDVYVPASVVYRGHTYTAEFKKRGAASLNYPKNSFTVKFTREDKFDEPEFPIWDGGFHEKRKISLTTTFDDNSYVRTRLAFELWNRLDPGHIQVQSYNAVLFLDGEYFGLYQVTDKVDGFLMEDFGLWQDGNLYKAINHDANFRLDSVQNDGAPKTTLHQGYEKKEGLPLEGQPGAFDDLEALVQFAATASPAEFAAEIDSRIDRRDYEDWWIFVSYIEADDSAGKNSYHYHNPTLGPWRYIPWDFNHAFGQTWQTERQSWDVHPDDYQWANGLFERFLADPQLAAPLRARYSAALAPDGAYHRDAILALLDAMLTEIAPSALRDESRWLPSYRTYGGWNWRTDFTTHEEEVAYLRQWISSRWSFARDNL